MPKSSLLEPAIIEVIERDLVPLILEANRDSSEALRSRPDRYSEEAMGYLSWNHINNGIYDNLKNSKNWDLAELPSKGVLICQAAGQRQRIRTCRVDPITRLPTSGKGARKEACASLFFSDDLRDLCLPQQGIIVGYDTGIFSGVGKITLQRLHSSGKTISTEILATLYDASEHDTKLQLAQQESIPKGKLSRRQEKPADGVAVGQK